MFAKRALKNLRVAVLAADGFETIELVSPVKRLRKEGADVRIISLRKDAIRGMNHLSPGKKLRVDHTVGLARPRDYDALLIPGGLANPDSLRQSEDALAFVREFDRTGRPIATLCHGPWVLISAGLVSGRRLASWPAIQDDIRNAGGSWIDATTVRDANWLTSRSPRDLPAFNQAMVSLFADRASRSIALARPRLEPRRDWAPWLLTASVLAGALCALTLRQQAWRRFA